MEPRKEQQPGAKIDVFDIVYRLFYLFVLNCYWCTFSTCYSYTIANPFHMHREKAHESTKWQLSFDVRDCRAIPHNPAHWLSDGALG